jgi:hypothetical protein
LLFLKNNQNLKTMKKFISFTLLLVVFISYGIFAQTVEPTISFDKDTHDFGSIKEEDGKVKYDFQFTNTGGKPLIINQVRASCGCTSPDWTKEPVLPGKKGFVSATYDPLNRPGPFNKSLTVVSNATNSDIVLYIKGEVTAKPATLEDVYRYSMGDIRIVTNHVSFPQILKGKTSTQEVEIINVSENPVKISFSKVPVHIVIKAVPEVLKPEEKGKIEVSYNSALKNEWGFVIDRVDVMLNDQFNGNDRLTISATIDEDFGSWTPEQLANAPSISFDNNTFDFKEIKQGDKVEHIFTITNAGKSDLIIRNVKASCGCTAVSPVDDIIKPGAATTMKVIFNSTGKTGAQNKTITIISNDPQKSRSILWIKGNVV